jgi:hypothetical protein
MIIERVAKTAIMRRSDDREGEKARDLSINHLKTLSTPFRATTVNAPRKGRKDRTETTISTPAT